MKIRNHRSWIRENVIFRSWIRENEKYRSWIRESIPPWGSLVGKISGRKNRKFTVPSISKETCEKSQLSRISWKKSRITVRKYTDIHGSWCNGQIMVMTISEIHNHGKKILNFTIHKKFTITVRKFSISRFTKNRQITFNDKSLGGPRTLIKKLSVNLKLGAGGDTKLYFARP